jgi:hypothetical protein
MRMPLQERREACLSFRIVLDARECADARRNQRPFARCGHLLASVKIGYLELRERSHIYLTVYFIDGNRCSPRRS